MTDACLISVGDLCVRYGQAYMPAVNHVSINLHRSESVALVGDSGCGKSTLALAMMRLLPRDAAIDGTVMLGPNDVLQVSERELQMIRGCRIAMVFQHPQAALNPVVRVGAQLAEVFRMWQRLNRKDARGAAVEMLRRVGLSDADRLYRAYAHELSGGMAQRVMLAIALAGKPELLIADEPTSGLDSNVQAQIVGLLREIQRDAGMSLLLITHDMGIAEALADRVCVMHEGAIVDVCALAELASAKRHAATARLVNAAKRKRDGAVSANGGAG